MEPGLALRIMKIREIERFNYQHVTTDKNDADVLSKECSVKQLIENNQW